jgi:hypothetical protein
VTGEEKTRRARLIAGSRELIRAIGEGDDASVEASVLKLSQSRRIFAPLAFAIGAFAMLFQGLKLLFSDWKLALLQILPAMWIWAAMMDLKVHLFRGHQFHVVEGPVLVPLVLAVTAVTMACFYLNAVFAFAIARPGKPQIRPGFAQASEHKGTILGVGFVVGLALGFSTMVVTRWGLGWFTLSLSLVLAVMMFTYVAVPARLIGMRAMRSRRDKLTASVIGGALGGAVCAPPYAIGRIGILLLGSGTTFVIGLVFLVVGFTLQAGATGAVKAIKMSAKLVAGHVPEPSASTNENGTSSSTHDEHAQLPEFHPPG